MFELVTGLFNVGKGTSCPLLTPTLLMFGLISNEWSLLSTIVSDGAISLVVGSAGVTVAVISGFGLVAFGSSGAAIGVAIVSELGACSVGCGLSVTILMELLSVDFGASVGVAGMLDVAFAGSAAICTRLDELVALELDVMGNVLFDSNFPSIV